MSTATTEKTVNISQKIKSNPEYVAKRSIAEEKELMLKILRRLKNEYMINEKIISREFSRREIEARLSPRI